LFGLITIILPLRFKTIIIHLKHTLMKETFLLPPDYRLWIEHVKTIIRSTQIKAALSVNEELIKLYWNLGKMIDEKLQNANWGEGIIKRIAADLKTEFPNSTGFSRDNLYFMLRFYRFYQDASSIVEQLVQQLPWGHNILIFRKLKTIEAATFYIKATIQNNWSRSILDIQIDTKLHERQGQAITNFDKTLPSPQAELAKETLKDPYIFDILSMTSNMHELELERQLTDQIIKLLLELGNGFAFLGRQYPLKIGEKEYAIDLLFYHIYLRCFVVIDLKMRDFEPEYAGKMNFYLSATDDILKHETDNPSIGVILCKSKNRFEVEYALRDLNKPIGVSGWILTEKLPDNLQSSFPTTEQLEEELKIRLKQETSKSDTKKKGKS
jgi:predicted nuclease of restriction endonuclease-like (RecB) superfamily